MYRLIYLGAGFKSGDTSLEDFNDGGLFLHGGDKERGEAIVGNTLGAILIRTRGDNCRDNRLDFLGDKAKFLAGGIEVHRANPVILDGAEGLNLGKYNAP